MTDLLEPDVAEAPGGRRRRWPWAAASVLVISVVIWCDRFNSAFGAADLR